jgi:toxin ParE1/3/4
MRYGVRVLGEAEEDLFEIHTYVAEKDSPSKAEALFDRLQRACESLAVYPARGRVSPELKSIGVFLYRELLVLSYRIFYRIEGRTVYVYAILDGRRDLSEILHERLLR